MVTSSWSTMAENFEERLLNNIFIEVYSKPSQTSMKTVLLAKTVNGFQQLTPPSISTYNWFTYPTVIKFSTFKL